MRRLAIVAVVLGGPRDSILRRIALVLILGVAATLAASTSRALQASDPPLFDPVEFLDQSTLDEAILQDWHIDTVNGATRQKLIEINVAEWWPGQDFRIPVRLIVPLTGTATGFHITGDHAYSSLEADAAPDALDTQLLAGGVGVVYTVVQPLESLPGGAQLAQEALDRLLEIHDLRYSAYWIWPMTLMRATTAAYAETGYFQPGPVAGSGGSKNGYAPAAALIHDERFTLTLSSVAPAYASPLRLYDQAAMDAVTAADDWFFAALDAAEIDPGEHTRQWYVNQSFLEAPDAFYRLALNAGWTWDEIRQLAADTAGEFYVSENWDQLMARGVDVLFQPGTHDFVAFDVLWGAQHHPEVPVYYRPGGGHDQTPHPQAETNVQNRQALILRHFFGGSPMLEPPSSSYRVVGDELTVSVTFDSGPQAQSGRIWWMFDRYPGGSAPFLWEKIPDDQWKEMTFDAGTGAWTATIPLEPSAAAVEFFSNHGLMVGGRQTYLSSPYTRVELPSGPPVGGIAELPAVAGPSGTSRIGSSTYAVLAGAAAGVVAFVALATLAVTRRGAR